MVVQGEAASAPDQSDFRPAIGADLPEKKKARSCHYCRHLWVNADRVYACAAPITDEWYVPAAFIALARETLAEVDIDRPALTCDFFALRRD